MTLAGCEASGPHNRTVYHLVERIVSPRHPVQLSELIGLSPAETQRKLSGLSVSWPAPMDLEVLEPDGLHSFVDLNHFLADDESGNTLSRGRSGRDFRALGFSQCAAAYAGDPTGVGALLDTLEFRNGRLIGLWRGPPEDGTFHAKATLEDGPDFTSHWGRSAVSPATSLFVQCTRHDFVATNGQSTTPATQGGNYLQAIAMLPFAVLLPGLNAKREAAMRKGGAAFTELRPGVRLALGATAFAATHRFVVAHRGADPSYALLEIDLGEDPSSNLTYSPQIGAAGVRNGQVIWRSPFGGIAGLARERELTDQ
jgi:hypothetical protein